jgi:cation:H+ antiporter
MTILSILLIIIGFAILVGGADIFVRSASSISKRFHVPNIVIGLTVVAFGTSAPELAVNIISATSGNTDLAIGNILGSNMANILLILGIGALIRDLSIKRDTTIKEIPFALLAILSIAILGNDIFLDGATGNILSRGDGLIFIGFFSIFLYYTYGLTKNDLKKNDAEDDIKLYSWPITILMFIGGITGLVLGGNLIVENAVKLASLAGLSEALIGFTIVAIGTSLPELATSIVAIRQGHIDLAVGNVIGSNIFNVFWVLGLTSIIMPMPFNPNTNMDLLVTGMSTILLFVFMFIHKKNFLQRWQGITFLLLYVSYIVFSIFRG